MQVKIVGRFHNSGKEKPGKEKLERSTVRGGALPST